VELSALTHNQTYHLILADIAMAAAIKVHDRGNAIALAETEYQPGLLRDRWLGMVASDQLRRQVTAMANAGMGSLQAMPAEELVFAAKAYGVPLDAVVAQKMAEHFTIKRDAMLTYRR
jgi:hypothetical protein